MTLYSEACWVLLNLPHQPQMHPQKPIRGADLGGALFFSIIFLKERLTPSICSSSVSICGSAGSICRGAVLICDSAVLICDRSENCYPKWPSIIFKLYFGRLWLKMNKLHIKIVTFCLSESRFAAVGSRIVNNLFIAILVTNKHIDQKNSLLHIPVTLSWIRHGCLKKNVLKCKKLRERFMFWWGSLTDYFFRINILSKSIIEDS